jgi:hypothetical protein
MTCQNLCWFEELCVALSYTTNKQSFKTAVSKTLCVNVCDLVYQTFT